MISYPRQRVGMKIHTQRRRAFYLLDKNVFPGD
jgi:hypothetical protein